jgi:hypothetical protein
MRGIAKAVLAVLVGSICSAHAQDRVTIKQWSTSPPTNVTVLPIPCPCFVAYYTSRNKLIINNICSSPFAALAIRRPAQGLQPDAPLSPAPNKQFAPFSLGVSEYLAIDYDPTLEYMFPHVSCPANPVFIPTTGTPRCIAQRFAQAPVLCQKDPAANIGDQCSCVFSGQSFDGQVIQTAPSPLD